MKFHLETEIQKPIDEVVQLFTNRDLMSRWQPGLIHNEIKKGHSENRTYNLTYRIGRRNLVITETILEDSLPDHYLVKFRLKGIRNTVKHQFKPQEKNTTRWIAEYDYSFRGLMWLISFNMNAGLEQQSKMIMRNFRSFAEKYSS